MDESRTNVRGAGKKPYLNFYHVTLIAAICKVATDRKVVKVVGALVFFGSGPQRVDVFRADPPLPLASKVFFRLGSIGT
jgi:hypothetical protein